MIIHGIGHQQEGTIARTIASELTRLDNSITSLVQPTENSPVVSIQLSEQTVLIAEGHWADLSHVDNLPILHLKSDTFINVLQSLKHGWNYLVFHQRVPSTSNPIAFFSYVGMSIVAGIWLVTQLLLISGRLWVSLPPQLKITVIQLENSKVLLICFWIFIGANILFVMRQWVKTFVEPTTAHWATAGIFFIPALYAGMFRAALASFGFIIGVPATVALLILALVTNVVGVVFLYPLQQLSSALTGWATPKFLCWIHRFAHVTVVMPVQSIVQAAKSFGNLIVLVSSDHKLCDRLVAAIWINIIFMVFALYFLLAGVILSPVLGPLGDIIQKWRDDLDKTIPLDLIISSLESLLIGLALIVLLAQWKWVNTLFDLILDVSNYHLASISDRKKLWDRVEAGYQALQKVGCTQIHILAHSLGSVIVYDWLHNRQTLPEATITSLYTIGSPLDKFWYIDYASNRNPPPESNDRGPRIMSWTNFWSILDIVSGKLHHVRPISGTIDNVHLWGLGYPLACHVDYWTNATVLKSIYNTILHGPTSHTGDLAPQSSTVPPQVKFRLFSSWRFVMAVVTAWLTHGLLLTWLQYNYARSHNKLASTIGIGSYFEERIAEVFSAIISHGIFGLIFGTIAWAIFRRYRTGGGSIPIDHDYRRWITFWGMITFMLLALLRASQTEFTLMR